MAGLNIKTTTDAINHLLHMVKQKCGEEKARELDYDIRETVLGSNVIATSGSIRNMKSERTKRYAADKRVLELESQNYDLIKRVEELEKQNSNLLDRVEVLHTTYSK